MKWLFGGLLLVLIIIFTATIGVGIFLAPQHKLEKSDAIVAISGGETHERTAEAVDLYQANWADLIIFSGAARDQGTSNAEAMEKIAVESGVPEENILLEDKAQDTFDNAKYVRDLLAENNVKKIILVTSPYHQRRAFITFRRILGPDVVIINHSAVDSAWRRNGWWKNDWARALTISELQKILILPLVFGLAGSRL